MALTPLYVSVTGAGAHDGSSEANAWTFQEMITAAPASGTIVHCKSGAYSEGVTTLPANGTLGNPIVLEVYNSTIGDLNDQGRLTTGPLDVTNFGTWTITGQWSPSERCVLKNFNITANLNSDILYTTGNDYLSFINCSFVNTANNASAGIMRVDDEAQFVNCDFECTGASHNRMIECDRYIQVVGCRFKTTAASQCIRFNNGSVVRSVFHGNSSSDGIFFDATQGDGAPAIIEANTIYNIGNAVIFTGGAHTGGTYSISNNHVTDCGQFIDNPSISVLTMTLLNNRTRDNTSANAGIEAIESGAVTTDTGGPETDYEDAANGDFRLIDGAPGRGKGMLRYTDIGAAQHEDPAGGGGGGGASPIGNNKGTIG